MFAHHAHYSLLVRYRPIVAYGYIIRVFGLWINTCKANYKKFDDIKFTICRGVTISSHLSGFLLQRVFSQQPRDADPMPFQCRPTVYDVGSLLGRRLVFARIVARLVIRLGPYYSVLKLELVMQHQIKQQHNAAASVYRYLPGCITSRTLYG